MACAPDIPWRTSWTLARAEAVQRQLPLFVLTLGQGMGDPDDW